MLLDVLYVLNTVERRFNMVGGKLC